MFWMIMKPTPKLFLIPEKKKWVKKALVIELQKKQQHFLQN